MREFDETYPPGPRHSHEFWRFEYQPVGQLTPDVAVFVAAERVLFRLLTHHGATLIRPHQTVEVQDGKIAVVQCRSGEIGVGGVDAEGRLYLIRSKAKDANSRQRHLLRDVQAGLIGGSRTRLEQWGYLLSNQRFFSPSRMSSGPTSAHTSS